MSCIYDDSICKYYEEGRCDFPSMGSGYPYDAPCFASENNEAYERGYAKGRADAEPHWIPVTEDTLPEEGRIVVVYGEKGTWDYGKYRGYGPNIHYWYWKNKTFKKVYWWMYKEDALPEPTKG